MLVHVHYGVMTPTFFVIYHGSVCVLSSVVEGMLNQSITVHRTTEVCEMNTIDTPQIKRAQL